MSSIAVLTPPIDTAGEILPAPIRVVPLPRRRQMAADRLAPGTILYLQTGAIPTDFAADVIVFDPGAVAAALPAGCYRERADGDPATGADRLRTLSGDGWRIIRLVDGTAASAHVAAELDHLANSGFETTPCADAIAIVVREFTGVASSPRESMVAFTGLAG